ncbi:MAG: UvrD-helicase domain-containing protein [Clostridia bacterium]|nr:UvrD-helicase domain-containing protein [Clostridia bacterium]
MTKKERTWTPDQKNALDARGTSLVVSAAAGSGKTSVLTERIVGLLSDETSAVKADRLVVVTFTANAAREVSARLYDALSRDIAEGKGAESHLSAQLLALSRAHISTIHAFCFSIIRDHRKKLGLPEKLRVGEDTQTDEMKKEAASEAVEDYLNGEKGKKNGEKLFRLFGSVKNASLLAESVLSVMNKISSYPDGSDGLVLGLEEMKKESLALLKGKYRFAETPLGSFVALLSEEKCLLAAHLLDEAAKAACPINEKGQKAVDDLFWRTEELRRAALLCRLGRFQEGEETVLQMLSVTRKPATALSDDEKNLIKAVYDKEVKAALKDFFKKYLPSEEEETAKETEEMLSLLSDFVSVLQDAEKRYGERKREKGILDFADLEHFALRLVAEKKDGKWQQSETGKRLAEEFDAVFVDEYQDTNEIQDMIFRFVSREDNLFIVGDPKQSIYRFRGAEPRVFTEYTQKTPLYEKNRGGMQKILLSANFRCDRSVVDLVNLIFRGVMRAEEENSLYKKEDELICSKVKGEKEKSYPAEIVLVEKPPKEEEGEEEEDSVPLEERGEISYICHRIEKILTEDEKEEGKLFQPGDIAVICETNDQVALVQNALEARNIPCAIASKREKNLIPEALFVRSLLGALDNPADDVSLLATLSSPVFRFSPDEMYAIRQKGRKISFFAAMKRVAEDDGHSLAPKVRETLQTLEELRLFSHRTPLSSFCFQLYRRLFIAELYASEAYPPWKDDLLLAAAEAGTQGLDTLGEFCHFLDRRKEKASIQGDGVRVINIHQSKGLEFPVVFVSFLGKTISSKDEDPTLLILQGKYMATPVLRLGGAAKKNTAYRKAIALSLREENREETVRKYYVAMTRAKQKLILTAQSGGVEALRAKLLFGTKPFSPEMRSLMEKNASSVLQMVLLALREEAPVKEYLLTGESAANETFSITSVLPPPFTPWEKREEEKLASPIHPLGECTPYFDFQYEEKEAQTLPRKLSVSELLRRGRDEEAGLTLMHLPDDRRHLLPDAAKIGTATHKVMQFIDFDKAKTDPDGAMESLVEKKFVSPEEMALVEKDAVRRFFSSPLFGRIAASCNVEHEKRFNVLLSAKDILGAEGEVLIQGVVDAWFEDPDGSLTLLDFKTDRVKEKDGEAVLLERHGEQLRLYCLAVESLTGKKVSELLLYSFALGREIPVPLKG